MFNEQQLTQYFERIHFKGQITISLTTLNELMLAHTQHIPFENIDILLKRPISLQMDTIFNKLVLAQRGGYCFEQNNLFAVVLKSLGFHVLSIGARVRLGTLERSEIPGRTHLLNLIKLKNTYYLADVGVGAASLSQALIMTPDLEQHTLHDTRRLQFESKRCFQQIWRTDHWQDVYEFTPEVFEPSDQLVANWYTSTSPNSHFTQDLNLAIALDRGQRATINKNQFNLRQASKTLESFQIQDQNQLATLLSQYFKIQINKKLIANLAKFVF